MGLVSDDAMAKARMGWGVGMNAPTPEWYAMNAKEAAEEVGATKAEQDEAYSNGWLKGQRVNAEYHAHMKGVTPDDFDKRLKEWAERGEGQHP